MHIKGTRCPSPEKYLVMMYDRRGKNLFKALNFLYGQVTSMDKSILRNIVGCYQNRNPFQAFCGDNASSKVLKKFSLVEPLFNENIEL